MLKLNGRGKHDKHTKVSDEQKLSLMQIPFLSSNAVIAGQRQIKHIWKQGLGFKRCMISTKKNA